MKKTYKPLGGRNKPWLITLTVIFYTVLFLLIYNILGRGVGALAIIPVLVIGWLSGLWGGIIAGILSFPFNLLILNLLKDEGIKSFVARAGGVAGTIALVLIGGVVGRMSELSKRVNRELAERKKTEEKLRDTSQTLLSLIKASPLAIVVFDAAGRVTIWNPAAEKIFGWNEHEVLGKLLPFVELEEKDSFLKELRVVFQGKALMDVEMHQKRKDGSFIDISLSTAPLTDDTGTCNAIMAIMSDITEQKGLQKQILAVSGREQRRIGEDLHDGLGQVLTGVAFMSRVLERKLSAKSLPEAESAASITHLVNEAIGQTRGLARGLYPVTLESDGIMAALEELAVTTENLFNISCKFTYNRPVRIDDSASAIHLYRIVQEAVNNAIRHGKAHHIMISLDSEEDKTILTVRDDGIGFEEPPKEKKGMGINLMRYRAKMIGASLEVHGLQGHGTTVTCILQLNHNKQFEGEQHDRGATENEGFNC